MSDNYDSKHTIKRVFGNKIKWLTPLENKRLNHKRRPKKAIYYGYNTCTR